ncbi:Putative symporter YfeH [Serratia symbiotica]|nr:Putative symporter YfeH [Serratia symbiotica]
MPWLKRLHINQFVLVLILVVSTASIFPCTGGWKIFLSYLTSAAIALLFFMRGAKLSHPTVSASMKHWRLHLVVFISTFALFPLIGLGMNLLVPGLITPTVYLGFLYLCALPATMQSSIAFISAAGGNVTAAICSAAASSILGVFLSPLLVRTLMPGQGGDGDVLQVINAVMLELIVPFLAGYCVRLLIVKWVDRNHKLINITDTSSIILLVYTAFSAAIEDNLWHNIGVGSLLSIFITSLLLLAVLVIINTYAARWLGFNTADEITIVLCGSQKSLANGIPMASMLFPAATAGIIVLPLMIFHQVQLIVCALLVQHYVDKIKKQRVTLDVKK